MEIDEFKKMEIREKTVLSLIGQLDKVSINDIGLIPALNEYILTGNISMFEDYKEFHFIKITEEKKQKIEKAKEKFEECKKLEEEIKADIQKHKEYQNQYYQFYESFSDWRHDLMNEIDSDLLRTESLTIRRLMKFIEDNSISTRGGTRLYVIVDGKIKCVTSISLSDDNKVLLELSNSSMLVCPPPERPEMFKLDLLNLKYSF